MLAASLAIVTSPCALYRKLRTNTRQEFARETETAGNYSQDASRFLNPRAPFHRRIGRALACIGHQHLYVNQHCSPSPLQLQTNRPPATPTNAFRARLGEPSRHLSLERQDAFSSPPRYALNPAVLGEGIEHGVDHGVLIAPPDCLALHEGGGACGG